MRKWHLATGKWNFGMLMIILGGCVINGQEYTETPFITCTHRCNCYEGLKTIRCPDSSYTALPVFSGSEVEDLDMTGSRIQELKPLSPFQFAKLKRLVLKNNKIKSISRGAFANAPALTELDLSYNSLRIIPRGTFSQSKLKVLNLENNPFSCSINDLKETLEEIKDLMRSDTSLEVFDVGKIKCASPADKRGQRMIDVQDDKIVAATPAPQHQFGQMVSSPSSSGTGLILGLVFGAVALLTALVGAVVIIIRRRKSRGKNTYDPVSSMDEDDSRQNQRKSENVLDEQEKGQVLAQRLKEVRRQSQGYPSNDITESEEDAVKK